MNIDKSCYNSFCEPAATERRSKKTHGYHSKFAKDCDEVA